jgi:hypothetical protein
MFARPPPPLPRRARAASTFLASEQLDVFVAIDALR